MAQGFSGRLGTSIAGSGPTDIFINGVKQASTSGTEIDFTIPSGVKEVKIMVDGLSGSGTDEPIIQLGDAGGIETTGYLGAGSNQAASLGTANSTTGLLLDGNSSAADIVQGLGILSLLDSATNTWVWSFVGAKSNAAAVVNGGGSKSLSGELTTVRLTWTGSNTFDAGSVNIQYDNPDPTVVANVQPGVVLQVVHSQDGEFSSGSTAIPNDDTIPQNTEGDEYMTCSITPLKSNSKLKIEVVVQGSTSTNNYFFAACLFQDSTADALAAAKAGRHAASSAQGTVTFTYWMTAGTTDSTTFKVRAGSSSGTFYFNGDAGVRKFGGVQFSSITITEYAA